MKKILLITFLAFFTSRNCLGEYPAGQVKAAKELIVAMDLEGTLQGTIEGMLEMQLQQSPVLVPYKNVMLQFFDKHMGIDALRDDFVSLYCDRFSEADLIALTAFYQSELGKKLVKYQVELTTEGAAIGQRAVEDNMAELQEMIAAETVKLQSKTN